MLYKAFAAVTLIAAPVVVMLVQNVAPPSLKPDLSPVVQPVVQQAPSMPQAVAPPVYASEPPPSPTSFGEPMPGAGQPFLSPGDGLPGGSSSAESEAGTSEAETSGDAPAP